MYFISKGQTLTFSIQVTKAFFEVRHITDITFWLLELEVD